MDSTRCFPELTAAGVEEGSGTESDSGIAEVDRAQRTWPVSDLDEYSRQLGARIRPLPP